MPKRSNEFQQFVTRIYTQLAPAGATVTESAMLRERGGGAEREIDILLEQEIVGHKVRIAIECRDRKGKEDVEWIDGLIGKFRDLAIDKVIAVSSAGFTRAATAKAAANNIETLTVEEANGRSWPAEFLQLGLLQFQRTDHLDRVDLVFDPPISSSLAPDMPLIFADNSQAQGIKSFLQSYFEIRVAHSVSDWLNQNWQTSFSTTASFQQPLFMQAVVGFHKPGVINLNGQEYKLVEATFWVRSEFVVTEQAVRRLGYNNMLVTEGKVDFGGLQSVIQIIQRPLPGA